MSFIRRYATSLPLLLSRFQRRPRIADPTEFGAFIESESAFIAQKSTVEYCRARAGLNWLKLFEEKGFQITLHAARWDAFAAVMADVLVVAEGDLRPFVADPVKLAAILADIYASRLSAHPALPDRPEGWSAEIAAFPARLAQVQLAAPQTAEKVGTVAGRRVFEIMPIHERLRRLDEEVVINSVRFSLIAFRDKMRARVDLQAVAHALEGARSQG